jgi:hypothetical protein
VPLIKCPDCGKDVSDLAPVCPKCGRPMPLINCPDCQTAISELAPACPSCGRPTANNRAPQSTHVSASSDGTPGSTSTGSPEERTPRTSDNVAASDELLEPSKSDAEKPGKPKHGGGLLGPFKSPWTLVALVAAILIGMAMTPMPEVDLGEAMPFYLGRGLGTFAVGAILSWLAFNWSARTRVWVPQGSLIGVLLVASLQWVGTTTNNPELSDAMEPDSMPGYLAWRTPSPDDVRTTIEGGRWQEEDPPVGLADNSLLHEYGWEDGILYMIISMPMEPVADGGRLFVRGYAILGVSCRSRSTKLEMMNMTTEDSRSAGWVSTPGEVWRRADPGGAADGALGVVCGWAQRNPDRGSP